MRIVDIAEAQVSPARWVRAEWEKGVDSSPGTPGGSAKKKIL
jgi:hypothetical protein